MLRNKLTMNDSSIPRNVRELINGERGVSPVIAVALLVLIAIGFAVAIQGVGSDLITSVEQPPEASIDANPEQDSLRLTVQNVQNADELVINKNGEPIESAVGELGTNAGNSTLIQYPSSGASDTLAVDEGDQINVVAVDFPENRRVVYTYTVPDNANP